MHQHAAKPHETPSEENPWETYAKARKLVAFEDDEARVSCSGRPVGVLFGDGRWHTVEGRLVEDPYSVSYTHLTLPTKLEV